MRGHWPACQFQSMLAMPVSRCPGRGGGDTRMWDMYVEYADISTADEVPSRIKARLAALSALAESQGVTGHAAFDGLRRLCSELQAEAVSTAIDAWRLSLTGRFRLLDQWCAFVQVHQRHAISEDTWRQVLEFSRSVHEDLSNYDQEGAWPVLVDEFVDNMYRKFACSRCSMDPANVCDCGIDGLTNVAPDDSSILPNRVTTLPGMAASAGSKRRRKDPKEEAAQAESVNCIAVRLAEMSTPLSSKRLRTSGCLVEVSDPMEGIDAEVQQAQALLEGRDQSDQFMQASGSIQVGPSESKTFDGNLEMASQDTSTEEAYDVLSSWPSLGRVDKVRMGQIGQANMVPAGAFALARFPARC